MPATPTSFAALRTELRTPPVACIVPDGVFDAFGWCASDTLEWRRPATWSADTDVTADNPPGMAFVFRGPHARSFLPHELARLHVHGLGLGDEWALAPYGIDDATDELYERRARPGELLWLAAAHLGALVWGLHDWAHFHSHGPFVERAWTELQCDATALAWLWNNRAAVGLGEGGWERVRGSVLGVAAGRFADEGKRFDSAWLAADRVRGLVGDGQPR